MLGTLGSFCAASLSALSLLFRFRFSPLALPLLLELDDVEAWTDWPWAGMSLDPLLFGFEGLEEDHRLWWPPTGLC